MADQDDRPIVAPASLTGRVSLRTGHALRSGPGRAQSTVPRPTPFSPGDAEQLVGLAFLQAPMAMALHSPDGEHLQVNPAYRRLVGRDEAAVMGTSVLDVLLPDDVPHLQAVRPALLAGERDQVVLELRFLRPDGTVVWGRVHIGAVRAADGSLRGTVTHVEDVSERVRRDVELAASERRYRTLVENLPALVVRYDRDLHPVLVGPSGVGPAGGDEHWQELVAKVIESGQPSEAQLEAVIRGRRHWYQVRAVPERNELGHLTNVLVVSSDITALKQSEAELAHRAVHDPLTGLANRALLVEFLERSLTRRRGAGIGPAVLFIDLDRFKWVNDALGHRAGDALLVAVARRLQSVVRPSDLIARLGGDEFVVVIDGFEEPREPARVAQRLQDELSTPFAIEGNEVVTSGSIGIAMATSADADADVLLRDADAAMYLAKANGRNRFEIYDAVLRAQADRKLRRESALRGAVDAGQLEVFYQPEVDLHTGTVVAVEALARWHHPVEGLLPADAFIGLAEETGAIHGVGGWVLRAACAEVGRRGAAAWPAEVALRVNLSGRQLAQVDLVAQVDGALGAGGIEPGRLRLEVAEAALMDDPGHHLAVLGELRALGVVVAVDNLGAGLSSLPFLARAPIDVLTIDGRFVRELGESAAAAELVASVVALARSGERRVVVGGVETQRQLDELRRLGCDRAQGNLFSPPGPAAEVWSLLGPFALEH